MKKGFTLVELLATIVILAIIVVLATNGYRGVSKQVKQTSYDNKVSLIETKAGNYGNEKGGQAIFVEDLVKQGYIEADDEAGNVYDPRDNSKMNCYIVNISYENDNVYGTYTNEKAETESGCDANKIEEMNNQVKLSIHEAISETEYKSEALEENKWTKENVFLIAEVDEEIKGKVKKIEFNGEREEIVEGNYEEKNKLYIRATQIINTMYKVRVEIEEENGDRKVYTGSIKVMIDKQAPIIYDKNINIANEADWSAGAKEVVIKASDESGSGIYGYYIGKNESRRNCADIPASEYKKNGTEENSYREQLASGNYYICVRDNVGNTTDGDTTEDINIEKVDGNVPTCELEAVGTLGSNGWYTSAIDIKFKKAEDADSGVGHTLIDIPTITEDTPGTTITGTVVDKVGNQSTCSITVKVDKTAPTCNYSGQSTTWTSGNRTIDVTCSDSGSGCAMHYVCSASASCYATSGESITYSQNTRTAIPNVTIEDNAGNETICKDTVNVYVDKCTQTTTSYGGWGGCSKSCGGGNQTRTVWRISTFGSGFTCSTYTESSSCNTGPCHSSGGGGGGGCQDECTAPGRGNACYGICGYGYNGSDCCTGCHSNC